ncbi:hypothetical protein NMY22_g14525 [Coprinellus aureogranulatus]|nr:hypothetical protein NMY22_g14525 [Coprinellus aureogranulatus]
MSQHTHRPEYTFPAQGFGSVGDLVSILNPIQDASHTRNLERSPPNSKCLPGTRKAVLTDIRTWAASNLHSSEPHIMWLYGYAGCGKSAIAREVALELDDDGLLAASFFFFRGAEDRSRLVRFACTVASQMASSIPETRETIEAAIGKNRGLLSASTVSPSLQFKRLVCNSIKAVAHLLSKPVLIVLDGVDECGDRDEMAALIEALILFFEIHTSTPLRVLITSRVEDHLHQRLYSSGQVKLLDLVDRTSEADIEAALDVEIKNKKGSRVLACNPSWPSPDDRRRLVGHIGGSFIFMTTIVKLLFDPKLMDGRTPMERLPLVLSTKPDFDDLYRSILEPSKNLPHFGAVVGAIVLVREALSIAQIAELLALKAANVANVLINLHAIMHIPGDDRTPVTLLHTSLRDFLTSEDRSGPFFVSPTYHIRIACGCIRSAVDSRPYAYSRRYAVEHLSRFLDSQSEESADPFNGALAGLEGILKSEDDTALVAAFSYKEFDTVHLLLENGANLNVGGFLSNYYYGTPLALASYHEAIKLVNQLLACGVDPNLRGGIYDTALQAACSGRQRPRKLEVVKLLLEHGADPNLTGGAWSSALHSCALWGEVDCAQALLEHQADPNLKGEPLLHAALQKPVVHLCATCLDASTRRASEINSTSSNVAPCCPFHNPHTLSILYPNMSAVEAAAAPAVEAAPAEAPSTSKKTTTKKAPAKATKAKAAPKAKAAASKQSARPSWKDIIKECIVSHKEEVRQGVSRATIKKFAQEKYGLDMESGSNQYQFSRAISTGVEGGIFVLPKGPSGKVKLAPKGKAASSASKENAKPAAAKAPATKKAVAKAAPAKAAPKKALAGKPKASTKKTGSVTKRGAAKKVCGDWVTGTTPAAKAKTAATKKAPAKPAAKKAPAKKTSAKKATPKPRSKKVGGMISWVGVS